MAQGNKGGIGKWIALGCVAFVLMGGCCAGGIYWFWSSQMEPPAEMARGFLGDVRRGNYQQALQRMNGQYQATHPLPTFQQNVQQVPGLADNTGVSFSERDVSGGIATLSGSLETTAGSQSITMTLSEQGDYWYVDSVIVGGQMLQ